MSAKNLSLASLCLVPLLFTACMQEKKAASPAPAAVSDSAVQVNSISSAVTDVQTKVGDISELTPGQTGIASMIYKMNLNFIMPKAYAALPEEFGDDWDINTPFQDPAYCGADCSAVYPGGIYHNRTIKYWLQAHLDKEFKRGNGSAANVFGRMNDNFRMICAIGQLVPSPNGGYPQNGTYNLTITKGKLTAITQVCDMSIDNPEELIGTQIQLVASDAATSTLYDKKFVLGLPGGETQTLFIRNNASFINVASAESGGHGQSRSLVSYDQVNKKLFFEYVSAAAGSGDNSMYVYRIFHNETTDKGYIIALEGGGNNGYADTRFTLAGKPNSGGSIALSMNRSQGNAFSEKKACILLADGSMAVDGTLNCTIAGVSVEDANLTALLTDAIAKRNDTDWASLNSEIGIGFSNEINMFSVNVVK